MTTYGQLAELILKRHYGGQLTQDGHVTLRQVMIHIMQVRDAWLNEVLAVQIAKGSEYLDGEILTTFDGIDILWDTIKDVAYAELPARPATLPKGKGLYTIRPTQGATRINQTEFYAIPAGSWFSMSRYMEGMVVYEYMGGSRVEFRNMTQGQYTKCMAQIVATDGEVSEDDPVRVPSGAEDWIVRKVLELLGVKEFDRVNDQ